MGIKERSLAVTEAKILKHLRHPCVIKYRRAFSEGGILHICMEYAAGNFSFYFQRLVVCGRDFKYIVIFKSVV